MLVAVPARDVVVELSEGLLVTGRVTDPNGRPLEGVWIGGQGRTARTGRDGTYRLSGLQPGEVLVRCHRYPEAIPDDDGPPLRSSGKTDTRRVEAGTAAVDFIIRSRTLDLHIVNEDGRPVPDAQVSLGGKMETSRIIHRVTGTPDEDGRVLTVVPRQDLLVVYVLADGYEPLTEVLRPDPEASAIRRRIVLVRSRGESALAVRAHLESGVPLRRLYLRLVSRAGSTVPGWEDRPLELDQAGAGRYEGVPPGDYTVLLSPRPRGASADGYGMRIQRELSIPVSATTAMDLSFPLGGRVRVTLRGADGRIVPPGMPNLYPEGSRWKYPVGFYAKVPAGYSQSSKSPRTVITGSPIPPGAYQLSIRDGRGGWQKVPVRVRAGEVTEVEARLLGGD
jgi:hypothetical protein